MSSFIPFYQKLWSDKKFKLLTTVDSQLLFIYLFTNETVNLTGIYDLDIELCKLRVKVDDARFFEALKKIVDLKMVEWDPEQEIIWVVNRFKLNPSKSPKVISGAISELNQLTHPFKERFISKYKDILGPYLCKLDDSRMKPDDLLNEAQVISLAKVYPDKQSLKRFFVARGCKEERVEDILRRVIPGMR